MKYRNFKRGNITEKSRKTLRKFFLLVLLMTTIPLFAQDLDLAKKLYQDGFYNASMEEARKFLSINPNSFRKGEALILMGDIYRKRNKKVNALSYYQKALSLSYFPDKDLALDRIGKLYMEEGKFDAARKYFLRISREFPFSSLVPESFYWIGETYLAENNYKKAEEYFHRLILLYPGSDFVKYAHYSLGYALFQEKEFEQALKEVEEIEKTFADPDLEGKAKILKARIYIAKKDFPSALSLLEELAKTSFAEEANFWIGEVYRKNEDFTRAREYFHKVLRYKNPSTGGSALFYLGWMDYEEGKQDSALKYFSRLLDTYPASTYRQSSLFYLGKIFKNKKNYPKARKYFALLLSEGKGIWAQRAYISLAKLMKEEGKSKEAIEFLGKFSEKFPGSSLTPEALYQLSLWLSKDSPDKSIAIYEKIKARFPDFAGMPTVLYNLGVLHFNQGNYFESARNFESLRKDFPRSSLVSDSLYWLARCYLEMGYFSRALGFLEEFEKKFPNSSLYAESFLIKALVYEKMGNLDNAINTLKEITKLNSKLVPQALIKMGDLYAKKGDFSEARKTYQKILQTFPRDSLAPQAYYNLAYTFYREGKLLQAASLFNSLGDKYPKSSLIPDAYYLAGWSYFRKGDYEKAREKFQEVLAKFPASSVVPRSILGMGDSYYNQGNFVKAKDWYQKLVDKYPEAKESSVALISLYNTYVQTEEMDTAIGFLKKYIEEKPQGEFADYSLLQLALYYMRKEDYPRATALLEKLKKEFPKSHLLPDSYYWLGRMYRDMKEFRKAEENFRPLYTSGKDNPWKEEAMLEVANMYYQEGNQEQALRLYSDFEKLFPDSPFLPRAWLNQGKIYLHLKQGDKALTIFRKIMASQASQKIKIEAEYSIAQILEQRGEKEKAAFEYLKLTYLFPAFGKRVKESLQKSARLLEEAGKYSEAVQVYKKLLSYGEDREKILQKIEELKKKSGKAEEKKEEGVK